MSDLQSIRSAVQAREGARAALAQKRLQQLVGDIGDPVDVFAGTVLLSLDEEVVDCERRRLRNRLLLSAQGSLDVALAAGGKVGGHPRAGRDGDDHHLGSEVAQHDRLGKPAQAALDRVKPFGDLVYLPPDTVPRLGLWLAWLADAVGYRLQLLTESIDVFADDLRLWAGRRFHALQPSAESRSVVNDLATPSEVAG